MFAAEFGARNEQRFDGDPVCQVACGIQCSTEQLVPVFPAARGNQNQALIQRAAKLFAHLSEGASRRLALDIPTVMNLIPQVLRKLIFLADIKNALISKNDNPVVIPLKDVVIAVPLPLVDRSSR